MLSEGTRQGTAQHGDLWKRIPGGDNVYPVQATRLALTEKRVKIETGDDGDTVIRYVPRESL